MTAPQLPTDETELYRAVIRGAAPLPHVAAAYDLAFRVPELWQWLMDNDFVAPREAGGRPAATIDFRAATDLARSVRLNNPHEAFPSVFPSGFPLRGFVENLTERHAKLCAEALLCGAGFIDAPSSSTTSCGP